MTQNGNSLYELSAQLAIVQDEIINGEGVVSEALEQRLDTLLPAITDKAGNISRWCINLDSNIDSIDAEITRLRKRKEVNDHLKERLKTYLKDCMGKAGLTKLDTGIMVISVQSNPPSVEVENPEIVPAAYRDVIPEQYVISKKRILEALKAGEVVAGATLRRGTHLKIR